MEEDQVRTVATPLPRKILRLETDMSGSCDQPFIRKQPTRCRLLYITGEHQNAMDSIWPRYRYFNCCIFSDKIVSSCNNAQIMRTSQFHHHLMTTCSAAEKACWLAAKPFRNYRSCSFYKSTYKTHRLSFHVTGLPYSYHPLPSQTWRYVTGSDVDEVEEMYFFYYMTSFKFWTMPLLQRSHPRAPR